MISLTLVFITVMPFVLAVLCEPPQRGPSPAQLEIEMARKMYQIRMRRIVQDEERAQDEERHRKLRHQVLGMTYRLQASSNRLKLCMEARGV